MVTSPETAPKQADLNPADCTTCQKPAALCVCSLVKPQSCRLKVLVLQHPQEPDQDLGSAWLAVQCLEGARLRIGLSTPNLAKAYGEAVDPSKWGVLYLGSGPKGQAPRGATLFCTDKKAVPKSPEENQKILDSLEGVVVLDGTWSQAKALWWRNAWMLKLKRLMLAPPKPSLYKELRKEPRRECLSTIESIALMLEAMGERPETSAHLRSSFEDLLNRYRQLRRGRGRR